MINPHFKKYKLLYNYFDLYFKSKKRFPQSIVLEGLDILSQYFFTLEIARNLNCEKDNDIDCNCTNCKWIKEGKHPSIVNVTPVDFKEDNTKTVISVKQIEKITSILNNTSDYHRFFIFSNAQIKPYNKIQEEKIKSFNNLGFVLDKEDWYPYPLNRKILQEEASNALLKSTEEAPDKVTFVFLTNTREDLISTITSRSLIFKMPSFFEQHKVKVDELFEKYPDFDFGNALELASKVISMSENYDAVDILDSMQDYLADILKQNLQIKNFIMEDIKKIQTAKKQLNARTGEKSVLETLFLSMSKEGRNL